MNAPHSHPPDAGGPKSPARRLWLLWRQGQRPDVRAFVAAAGALSLADLVAVLRVDQHERWLTGERVLAEAYLSAFPAVASDREAAFHLVCSEYLLREELSDGASLADYSRRFPALAESLRLQIAFHHAVAPSGAPWPRIPGYEILAELGHGGMGAVYKARHLRLDRIDAIKVIRRDLLAEPDAVPRFEREARAAAKLSHPNIVGVHYAGEADGQLYLVMEHLAGTDLGRLVQSGPLPLGLACGCVRQAALGLQHAHEQALVHRDVKPSNLLLTEAGVLKVLDLGLARVGHGQPSVPRGPPRRRHRRGRLAAPGPRRPAAVAERAGARRHHRSGVRPRRADLLHRGHDWGGAAVEAAG